MRKVLREVDRILLSSTMIDLTLIRSTIKLTTETKPKGTTKNG